MSDIFFIMSVEIRAFGVLVLTNGVMYGRLGSRREKFAGLYFRGVGAQCHGVTLIWSLTLLW